jgi:ribonuclease BN (tRNA processing enzyme)
MVAFLSGCELVVLDTMFELDEYLEKMTWGHAFPEYAAALCRAAGVHHLVLFHHSPEDDDDRLDARAERWAGEPGLRVTCAREGETLTVEG